MKKPNYLDNFDLNYVSFQEIKDLNKSTFNIVDFQIKDDNNIETCLFCKTVSCGSINTEKELSIIFQKEFIQTIKRLNCQIINVDKNIIKEKPNILEIIIEKFNKLLPSNSEDYFVIISTNLKNELNDVILMSKGIGARYSDNISNEIIFGKKTSVEESGIVLISNEEGLSDKNNLRFAFTDIGFFPEKNYYIIKIN